MQEQEQLNKIMNFSPKDIKKPFEDEKTREPIQSDVEVVPVSFEFVGSISIFTNEQLQKIVKPFLNNKQTINDLYTILDKIRNEYRKLGFTVVSAYFPKQDVTDGHIKVGIREAKVDSSTNGITIDGNNLRINKKYILKIVEKSVKPGRLIQQDNLDRSILLIQDIPGLQGSISLKPGIEENSTALTYTLYEGKQISPYVTIDNTGNRYTGSYILTAGSNFLDLNGYGDKITISATNSFGYGGQNIGNIDYSSNVGFSGLRLGVSSMYLKYKLGSETYDSSDLKGTGNTYKIYAKYPLYRTNLTNAKLDFTYKEANTKNTAAGAVTSKNTITSFISKLNLDHSDQIFGGGYSSLILEYTTGKNTIKDDTQLTNDQGSAGAHTSGNFEKANMYFSRVQQTSNPNMYLNINASGQFAYDNLDGAEKFQLGGPAGVRAYPSGEASGVDGFKSSIELSYQSTTNLKLKTFYDYGKITKAYKDYYAMNVDPKKWELKGWGIGADYSYSNDLNASVTLAQKIGSNPNADSTTGNDSDGKDDKRRIWFSVQQNF